MSLCMQIMLHIARQENFVSVTDYLMVSYDIGDSKHDTTCLVDFGMKECGSIPFMPVCICTLKYVYMYVHDPVSLYIDCCLYSLLRCMVSTNE